VLAWEMLTSKNPFEGKTREVTLKKILTGKLALPSYFDSQTHSLLKGEHALHAAKSALRSLSLGLLHKDPKCRLRKVASIFCCRKHFLTRSQAVDIKAHAFFKGVKWDKMLELAVPPPFIPDIDGSSSLKYVRSKYLDQVRTLFLLAACMFPSLF
jgi:hypothetical protein